MLARILYHLFMLISVCFVSAVHADSAIQQVRIYEDNQTIFVNVSSRIDFPVAVTEAIHSGIPLIFQYQFEIKNDRWYKPQPLVKINKTYHLSYERMTNQYRVNNPVTLENQLFTTLYEAKLFMQNVQAFPLTLNSQLPSEANTLGVRFYLTNDNLPTFIRVERFFNDNWSINSDWRFWQLP